MTLTLVKDNLNPPIADTLTSGGVPVDLTGKTLKLQARPTNSAALKIDANASVVSPTAGTWRYDQAAADVDTVGDFIAWLRVTTTATGKFQDTPEFDFTIVEHAPTSTPVPAPVATDGSGVTTIYQGDSYLEVYGRALHYQLTLRDSPDLTGLTVKWRVASIGFVKTMTVVGEDEVRVDLTTAETAAFTAGSKNFEIEATVTSGEVVTLLRSTLNVLADLA